MDRFRMTTTGDAGVLLDKVILKTDILVCNETNKFMDVLLARSATHAGRTLLQTRTRVDLSSIIWGGTVICIVRQIDEDLEG